MINEIINKLTNKKILILGFGREGKSTYNFIKNNNIFVDLTIFDENPLDQEYDAKIIIEKLTQTVMEGYDLIFKTPGISLKDYDTTNLNITSQLEILFEFYKENVIAITGTKGKSTTSSLIYQVLKDQGIDTHLVGNIGIPILDKINEFTDTSKIVVECSSHQLQFVKTSPHIALLLNLYPEHLDHYNNIDEYYGSKLNIFKYQTKEDYIIINNTIKNNLTNNSKHIIIDEDIYIEDNHIVINNNKVYDTTNERKLLGDHNLQNIKFVLGVINILNLDLSKSIKTINEFKSLEHRIELVGTYNKVTYYNDSIATIPAATINCVKALKNINTLIIGGMDRGIEYQELIDFINNSDIENVVCLPKTGHDLINRITKKTYKVENLEEAVIVCKKVTKENTSCLLSPAASSYGYFKNFEDRGNKFKELVKNQ